MPNVIAHVLSAQRALEALPGLQSMIQQYPGAYYLGAQGPDPLFYYNLKIGRFGSDVAFTGQQLHGKRTNRTFRTLLKNAGDDPLLLSYVAGWITHYVLDATAHPYVYWMSGCTQSKLRKPRYSFYHQRFEADLDMALWEERKVPRDWLWFAMSAAQRMRIATLLSSVCDLETEKLDEALHHFVRTRRRLYDGKGKKYRRLLLVEQVFGMTDMISAGFYQRDTVDYTLNLEKNTWALPWKPTLERNESYYDLVDEAHEKNCALLTGLEAYVAGTMSASTLGAMYGNKSHYTGENCNKKAVMFTHDCIYERQEIRGLSGLRLAYNEG